MEIAVSLISHTNVGKTTLARTLLRRDVGEVRDQAHVTMESAKHLLIATPQGDRLFLWDTPGFGDSHRLLQRLRQQSNPVAWILSQLWDRWRNVALWCSREAIRNVKEEADVVLYLVGATESPQTAGYVEAEVEILKWIGKPVLVILNQVAPGDSSAETPPIEGEWRRFVALHPPLRDVLRLDAFARCWLEEGVLLDRVQSVVPDEKREPMARIVAVWQQTNFEIFEDAVDRMAGFLASAATDRENAADAREQLSRRLSASLAATNAALLRIHGLAGNAASELGARIDDVSAPGSRPNPWKVGAAGGLVAGIMTGLAVDVAAGGMTFGGGAIVGGLLGALGAGGGAWAFNEVSGPGEARHWTPESLDRQVVDSCLRYLSIAHYGRGAGAFSEREQPSFWRETVEEAFRARRATFAGVWESAREDEPRAAERLAHERLSAMMRELLREVLCRFYQWPA